MVAQAVSYSGVPIVRFCVLYVVHLITYLFIFYSVLFFFFPGKLKWVVGGGDEGGGQGSFAIPTGLQSKSWQTPTQKLFPALTGILVQLLDKRRLPSPGWSGHGM